MTDLERLEHIVKWCQSQLDRPAYLASSSPQTMVKGAMAIAQHHVYESKKSAESKSNAT